MANIAVLASGSGSNFEAIAMAFQKAGGRHLVSTLICDQAKAFALKRAERLGIPSVIVSYRGRTRDAAESELASAIDASQASLVALAGFMRILTPNFIKRYRGRIINIHPSLLPDYPGIHSIKRAFSAGESSLGVTVHYVDEGMDTGAVIEQVKVPRRATLEETESAIHDAEHELYPRVLARMLDMY